MVLQATDFETISDNLIIPDHLVQVLRIDLSSKCLAAKDFKFLSSAQSHLKNIEYSSLAQDFLVLAHASSLEICLFDIVHDIVEIISEFVNQLVQFDRNAHYFGFLGVLLRAWNVKADYYCTC